MGMDRRFLGMMQTLYNNAESATINQGVTSKYFSLERGARQGDPVSPYLFVAALEPLLRTLGAECEGIKTKGGVMTHTSYADDLLPICGGVADAKKALSIVQEFGKASGLVINKDKCKVLCFGTWTEAEKEELGVPVVQIVEVTGVHVGKSELQDEIDDSNWGPTTAAFRRVLGMWKSRIISLGGKVAAVKGQGLSQFQYLASAVDVPEEHEKTMIKETKAYLGTKISRERLAKTWDEGGLAMP